MHNKILIATGGTGGHLLPAQQLAALLQRQGCEVVFAGYKLRTSPYFQRNTFRFVEIVSTSRLWFIPSLARGVWQALRMLWREKPDVVVGFGSYHAAPVLLASALLRKRIVLFEANRKMGKVNRYFFFAAKAVGYQFPLERTHSKLVAVRWLPWLENKEQLWTQSNARSAYGLDPASFTILIFGGSQGASFLNQTAPAVIKQLYRSRSKSVKNVKEAPCNLSQAKLAPKQLNLKSLAMQAGLKFSGCPTQTDSHFLSVSGIGAQVIHLAGSESGAQGAQETRALYEQEGVRAHVALYEQEMQKAYAAADFALCRSGASTVMELIRYAVPSLLIPYPYAAQHQRDNAQYVCDLGGAIMLQEREANVTAMANAIAGADVRAMRCALQSASQENSHLMSFHELVRQVCKKKSYTIL